MILRTRFGTELLAYLPGDQPHVPAEDQHIPLTFCVVVVQHGDHVVLVYERERHQWEIPGGGILPGEAPETCAHRELWEEATQQVSALTFVALFKLRHANGSLEYGALYRGQLDQLTEFVPNEETDRLLLWDSLAPLDDHLSEFSRAMIEYVRAL